MFDIMGFYSSIKGGLPMGTLKFAKQLVIMKDKDSEIIFHVRTSIWNNEGEPWIKKQSNHFDITMGSQKGAEVCELISIFLLSLIGSKYNPNIIDYT